MSNPFGPRVSLGFEGRDSHGLPDRTQQYLRRQPGSISFGQQLVRPWADEEEDSTLGGEGEVLTGLKAGKLVGEDASQICLLGASSRDPSHGPTHLALEVTFSMVGNSLR